MDETMRVCVEIARYERFLRQARIFVRVTFVPAFRVGPARLLILWQLGFLATDQLTRLTCAYLQDDMRS